MSDLTELQQRVEHAEQRFGALGSQHAKFSARLIELMDQIERQATERQQEIQLYVTEIAQARQERDQVKTMLQDLLHAIEAGSHAVLSDTLHELDRRASAILGAMPVPVSTGTVVPFTGRFEDVSAAELEAETAAEANESSADAVEGDPEVNDALANETEYGPKLPAALTAEAASPVAEIIDRIGRLTQALMETQAPSAPREAEATEETVRRIA